MKNSNSDITQYLISSAGILATIVSDIDGSNESSRIFEARPPKFSSALDVMRQAAKLYQSCGDPTMRIIIGSGNSQETIVCFSNGERMAVVAIPTGHEIMKSIRRMLTRALKDGRAVRTSKPPQSTDHSIEDALENLEASGLVERVKDQDDPVIHPSIG